MFRWRLVFGLAALVLVSTRSLVSPQAADEDQAAVHHRLGVAHHLRRSLDEASREYARVVALEPPREPSAEEQAIVRRFAPRIHTQPTEFFPLADFAAILHPDRRLIAYHLFWQDDIDFPEDNDPCDHEVVWVQYSADGRSIEEVWTYFHGHILQGGEAARRDARRHAMRPRVDVQWGKHGSMPAGWEHLPLGGGPEIPERPTGPQGEPLTVLRYNQATYRTLSTEGRRLPDHPRARRLRWPLRFTGTWEQFVDFSRPLDPVPLLDRNGMVAVSRWNSATINQHFLAYNFRPKTEWPPEAISSPASAER